MHHGIGALRRFDGVLHLQRAAFILRVGQDDHGLAPGFVGQLVVAREVHGVVKDRAGNRLAQRPLRARRVDARAVDGAVEHALIVGEIGQQVGVAYRS